jgi:hypothetical protein
MDGEFGAIVECRSEFRFFPDGENSPDVQEEFSLVEV